MKKAHMFLTIEEGNPSRRFLSYSMALLGQSQPESGVIRELPKTF
jgi:hypothetical protein